MRSEPVASIGGVEGVEIRASVLRCETIAAICINVNLNLVRRLGRSAVRRDMSIDFAEQTTQAPSERHGKTGSLMPLLRRSLFGLVACFAINMTRLTALSGSRAFFLTKLCLIPPSSHE
jgi:hypothetical protein